MIVKNLLKLVTYVLKPKRILKINALQANYPNEIIHMDLTDLPDLIKNGKDINVDKKSKIAEVIDNLSKFVYTEIIPSKLAKDVLPVLMRYVNIKEEQKILLTYNGTEFV